MSLIEDAIGRVEHGRVERCDGQPQQFTNFQMKSGLGTEGIFALVAERDGEIVGGVSPKLGADLAAPLLRSGRVEQLAQEVACVAVRAGRDVLRSALSDDGAAACPTLGSHVHDPV